MNDKLIVIVDDEPGVVSTISEYLSAKGFDTKGFSNSKDLFTFMAKEEKPDLIILDLILPGMPGFEICRKLKEKERYASIPIIMVSAKGEEPDKVSGLDLGADDYMVKPFSLEELTARINAVLRRQAPEEQEEKITVGENLVMDLKRYEVTVDGGKVDLTPTEFKILECLSSRKNQVFTRDRILDYLWGEEKIVIARTIDVHVRHLREKLGSAGDMIKNVRGIGYKLEDA